MLFSSCAKWVLTGEHTVIRHGKAVVFPLKHLRSTLEFLPSKSMTINDPNASKISLLTLIEKASELTGLPFPLFSGNYNINSKIPLGSGLGSSAALCVNIAKLCASLGYAGDIMNLSRTLENEFHGKSSGMDVAASFLENPLIFQNNKVQRYLKIHQLPNFTLTYCGVSSCTSKCIDQVQNLITKDPVLGKELDKQMDISADLCINGLESYDLKILAEGINLSAKVFESWGLISDELRNTITILKSKGALAAKPVGSGLGGYVVGLW
ncbi:MAG: hypothetical protein E7015_01355 [Alphaproteobacteria bacterium]|nr:hypothetical protein [Alphaproteobacteria bacterium]